MKKLIPILLLTALLLSACADSGSGDKQAAQSESPAVDTAQTLASDHTVITLNGESAEIRAAAPGTREPLSPSAPPAPMRSPERASTKPSWWTPATTPWT